MIMVQDFNELSCDQLSTILNSITDGVFTVDSEWRITSFNHAAEQITGIQRNEAIGRLCCEVFRANICESACCLRHTLETGTPIVNQSIYIVNADGQQIPISISTAILRDSDNRIIGGVETFRDLTQVEVLRKELRKSYSFGDIVSKNHRMQELFKILPDIAQSNSHVFINGESGTGKELFAHAIHEFSPRADKPFVAINCGALPDTLLESELFGYKAGAFTDAKQDKPGRFALAEGGTLFLDEIGDISPALQVRLLRVLQEKQYDPLGSTKPVHTDVRIITATNKDLKKLVKKGTFRQDLFYRIHIINLTLPPLRERKEDIPYLIQHFIDRFNQLQGKNIARVSNLALHCLTNHDYPGNIRELENIIEHGFVLCQSDTIDIHHLPTHVQPETPIASPMNLSKVKEAEKQIILEALERNNWNRKQAADEMGIHKSTLFRKITKYGIELPPVDGRTNRS
jgi:PAS domain S-box-containing protein